MRKDKDYLPKLLEYIELANKIPSDFIFPDRNKVFELALQNSEDKRNVNAQLMLQAYISVFKDLPKELYDFIFQVKEFESWDEIEAIQKRIDLLSSISYGLTSLGYFVTEEHFSKFSDYPMDLNDYLIDLKGNFPEYIADLRVEILVDKDGFIKLVSSEFYDLIATHKIEARRIRTCIICRKVFWAKRIDKWTCSKGCGNTLRQRIWQFENKEEYNERRRKNYAYKNSVKIKKEKKKNGSL